MIRQGNYNNRALSLIELMVVIAIIGILAALLLTAVSKAKGKAQRIQCVGNLHQIGVGLQNCLANNHGYPSTSERESKNSDAPWYWQIEVNGFGISHPENYDIYQPKGVWHCPSALWKQTGLRISYWFNADGVQPGSSLGLGGRLAQSAGGLTFAPIAESGVISPVNMMAIGDSFTGLERMERKAVAFFELCGNARSRHQGKGDVLFCDGHVESPTLHFLFEDTSDEALCRWNRDHQPHRDLLAP